MGREGVGVPYLIYISSYTCMNECMGGLGSLSESRKVWRCGTHGMTIVQVNTWCGQHQKFSWTKNDQILEIES